MMLPQSARSLLGRLSDNRSGGGGSYAAPPLPGGGGGGGGEKEDLQALERQHRHVIEQLSIPRAVGQDVDHLLRARVRTASSPAEPPPLTEDAGRRLGADPW